MITLQGFALLLFAGSMLIGGAVNAKSIRAHQSSGEFDFSFPKSRSQGNGHKIARAAAKFNLPDNLESVFSKHANKDSFSGPSIFSQFDGKHLEQLNRHENPLKFLFDKKREGRFRKVFENNPRYADLLLGSDYQHGLIDKKMISRNSPKDPSVVPIPAAVWLMFSALAVLGWRGKKRGENQVENSIVAGQPAFNEKTVANTN